MGASSGDSPVDATRRLAAFRHDAGYAAAVFEALCGDRHVPSCAAWLADAIAKAVESGGAWAVTLTRTNIFLNVGPVRLLNISPESLWFATTDDAGRVPSWVEQRTHRRDDVVLYKSRRKLEFLRRARADARTHVRVSRETAALLAAASQQMRTRAPREEFELEGHVVRLDNENAPAQGGSIVIAAEVDGDTRRVRLSLSAADYQIAIEAHLRRVATAERRRDRRRAPAAACRERRSGTIAPHRAGSRKLRLAVVLDRPLRAARSPRLPRALMFGTIRGGFFIDRLDDDASDRSAS